MASTTVWLPKCPVNTGGAPKVGAGSSAQSVSSAAIWSCSTCMAVMIPIFIVEFLWRFAYKNTAFRPTLCNFAT
jgi:hypothetical protein